MPTGNLTLYDLACLQRNDPYTGLIEDVTTLAPEFTTLHAQKREGTWYEIVKRTSLPTAQFRPVNQGVSASKSVYKKEVKEMFFIDVPINMDEAIWKGDDASAGSAWQNEAEGAMRACAILIGAQTYYGTSQDTNGFAGLRSQYSYVVGAGGTTNSTSAYLVWTDPKQGVRYDVGRDGNFAISPPLRQQVADSNNTGKNYFAYVGNLSAFVGLNVGSNLSVFAVTGITSHTTGGKTDQALTDDIGSQLIANIPVARRTNLKWFMNRLSESVLQRNRSTIQVGQAGSYQAADSAGRPAFSPLPEQLCGYPIVLTDSITNTESN